jgi:hypothetical protein
VEKIATERPMEKGWIWAGDHWILDVCLIGEITEPGVYRLRMYVEGADYSDFTTGEHIGSIGVDKTGKIWAATDGRYVNKRRFHLLWVA